jgi:4-carboxymuconolactone decarboxylase
MAARKPRPTSPRIPPVTEPTPLQQELFDLQRVGSGGVGNIFATMAHNTRVFRHWSKLGATLLFRGSVPAREREIVILRVGWNAQSVYEFGQHTVIGRSVGLSDDEIRLLCRPVEEGDWSAGDRDLVLLADELCADDCVSDATWSRLADRWSDEQLVELVVCAGFYRLVSGFLNSTGVQLDEGVPSWPPGVFDG